MTPGYSIADRLLYRVALGSRTLQKSLADIESRLNAAQLRQTPADRPVFIASLPRAGTTLLLEALHRTGAFAAQTYRDMPFVLCPLLWRSVSGGFRRKAALRERAHGDGVAIGYDSPEAFEEVLWKAFWPWKYAPDKILTWSSRDRDGEFEEAFAAHMRKVVAMAGRTGAGTPRYLSKNNANIVRLPLLAELYPDCTILIPFRNPADHAGSLARQHTRFLKLHDGDRFAQSYMEWIGHYEFGRAFRPFAFPGEPVGETGTPNYWLDYWDRGFRHILGELPNQARLIDYDRLCDAPQTGLRALAEILEVPAGQLCDQAHRFHAANHYDAIPTGPPAARARETYENLRRLAVDAG